MNKTQKAAGVLTNWGIDRVNLQDAIRGRRYKQKQDIDAAIKTIDDTITELAQDVDLPYKHDRKAVLSLIETNIKLDDLARIARDDTRAFTTNWATYSTSDALKAVQVESNQKPSKGGN